MTSVDGPTSFMPDDSEPVDRDADRIHVEVIAAWPDVQPIVSLTLDAGSRVQDAIRMSGLTERFPQLDIRADRVGIFGELCSPQRVLDDGDRVELYRPLLADPKEARRRKAGSS